MGLVNSIVIKTLKKEASKTSTEARKQYDSFKKQFPQIAENLIFRKMIVDDDRFEQLSQEAKNYVNILSQSINGVCYSKAIDTGKLEGMMVLRLLEFTQFMDKELIDSGFPKQSRNEKEQILKAMKLAVGDYDRFLD